MSRWKRNILVLLLTALFLPSLYASERKKKPADSSKYQEYVLDLNYRTQMHSDTMAVPFNYRDLDERSDAFYDTLKYKKYKNPLMKLLMRYLVRSRDASDEGIPSTALKRNREYFERFGGKTIHEIKIIQANVFSPRDSSEKVGWVQRLIDKSHVQTREKQLVQNLLFKEGDLLDPYAMGINEKLLRSQPYFSTAYFIVTNHPTDPDGVIVTVFARDNWSISGKVNFGGDRKEIAVFDRNFLGLADELKLTYTCDDFLADQPGFEIDYTLRNLFGTFTNVKLELGVGEGQNIARFTFDRPFILPNDYALGFSAGHVYRKEKQRLVDTSLYVDRFDLNLWTGRSWALNPGNGTSIYFSSGYGKRHYNVRPTVDTTLNPYYHNYHEIMFNLGIGRKNFFQGNMIYGFGRTEDIPYGFRGELIFGRRWDDLLGSRQYFGSRIFWADLIGNHYLEAGLSGGTFVKNGQSQQGVFNASLKYFTPLVRISTGYARQFMLITLSRGFHRFQGEREALRYEKAYAIRGLKSNDELLGYNRLTLSTETVVFTPIFLYHFRFAFFGFGDVGWLGDRNNILKNKFTGSVGLGVRLKNERLIFNNIQLRIGMSFNRPDGVGYSTFGVSNQPRYQEYNFLPGKPQIIQYQ